MYRIDHSCMLSEADSLMAHISTFTGNADRDISHWSRVGHRHHKVIVIFQFKNLILKISFSFILINL